MEGRGGAWRIDVIISHVVSLAKGACASAHRRTPEASPAHQHDAQRRVPPPLHACAPRHCPTAPRSFSPPSNLHIAT